MALDCEMELGDISVLVLSFVYSVLWNFLLKLNMRKFQPYSKSVRDNMSDIFLQDDVDSIRLTVRYFTNWANFNRSFVH